MPALKLFLLGPPQVELGGQMLELKRRKLWALLAYLAASGETHRRDTLATLLWPDSDQSEARAALARHLSELRTAIGAESVIADRETAGLGGEVWLDVTQFQQLVTDCAGPNPDCLDPLTKAIALYRAGFLSGFTLPDCPDFDEWQFFQTEGLRQQLAIALERLIEIYIHQHHFDLAIPYARRWLALDPLHEPAQQQLMQLYAWSGQWAAALRQYETCRRLLETELSVQPTEETEQLYQAIKAKRLPLPPVLPAKATETAKGDEADGLAPASSALAQAAPQAEARPLGWRGRYELGAEVGQKRHNLPPQPTPFIGREAELAELDQLLAKPESRLTTIVGPGGMGKTRLALACAERQLTPSNSPYEGEDSAASPLTGGSEGGLFPNGVFFIALAPLRFAEHIVPTMAEVFNFQLEGGGQGTRSPRQQILDYLRSKRLLLVLDNFEHLLDGVDLVADILQAAPEVKILVTSRERLHLRLEQLYPIQGLEFPDWETPEDAAEYTAARLFIQSARRIRPDFALQAGDLTYLARICRLVDGMPLGVELAAAWVDLLTLADIAAEIQQGLDFLETDMHDVPERHRSLRAIFDASWQRLSQREQAAMAQLSVFRGGFRRSAAQQVAGANLKTLATLANKSLLQVNQSRDRYDIHELVRKYAAEKLAESPFSNSPQRGENFSTSSLSASPFAEGIEGGRGIEGGQSVRDRHSAYYCAALQQREANLKGPEQLAALAEIEADIENVRLAWDWAVEQGQGERLGQALESLGRFYEWYGRYLEGEAVFQAASNSLAQAGDDQRMRVRLLTWRATFKRMLGQTEQAQQLLAQASAWLDRADLAGQDVRSERAGVWLGLGNVAADIGDGQAARQRYEQSIALYQAINDRWSLARVLYDLGRCLRVYGDHGTAGQHLYELAEAKALAEQSLAICQELGDRAGIAASLHSMGVALLYQGQFTEAYASVKEAVTLYTGLGVRRGLVRSKTHLSLIHGCLGQFEQAYAEADSALHLAQEVGYRRRVSDVYVAKILISLRKELYDEVLGLYLEFAAICRETGEQFGLAIALGYLGCANVGLGQFAPARLALVEAFRLGVTMRSWMIVVFPIMYISQLWLKLAEVEAGAASLSRAKQAIELSALAMRYPGISNDSFWKNLCEAQIAAVAAILPPVEIAAAQEQGRNRDLWATAEEVLAALEAEAA